MGERMGEPAGRQSLSGALPLCYIRRRRAKLESDLRRGGPDAGQEAGAIGRSITSRVISRAPSPTSEAHLAPPVPPPSLLAPTRRALLRGWAAAWALAAASLVFTGQARAQDARPTVFVFLQLDIKSSALEQALQKQLPGLALTVFGRFRDYQDAVTTKNPDAIVAITPLLDLDHTKATLQGVRGGKEWEPYLLVTTAAGAPSSWTGKTVGIVDLLGRDGTQTFAANAIGSTDVKVKRVAKIEDLLPLLEFSAADAVLVPSSAVKRFTERTRLPLTVRDLPNARVGLPAVAVRNEKTRITVVQAIQKLDPETRLLIGIDTWSAR
jgi:hypothetical protein